MDSVYREREVLRKNQKDMLEIKNTVTETNNAFDGLIIDWTWLRKESEDIQHPQDIERLCQKKLSKLKSKEKRVGEKAKKHKTDYPQNTGTNAEQVPPKATPGHIV